MNTVKTIRIVALLVMLMGLGMSNQSHAQTTIWKFDAADNSGAMVQITVVGDDQSVSKVELGKKGDAAWTGTEILSMDEYETYIRVKSKGSGRVYELNINWYDGKTVVTRPDGTCVTYWLRKS